MREYYVNVMLVTGRQFSDYQHGVAITKDLGLSVTINPRDKAITVNDQPLIRKKSRLLRSDLKTQVNLTDPDWQAQLEKLIEQLAEEKQLFV
ncbi:TPA: hypothetical protein DIU46_01845 [Patescibacteria group bacterium]|nr:hypothetical protein [Patescibacteria group bacterium]